MILQESSLRVPAGNTRENLPLKSVFPPTLVFILPLFVLLFPDQSQLLAVKCLPPHPIWVLVNLRIFSKFFSNTNTSKKGVDYTHESRGRFWTCESKALTRSSTFPQGFITSKLRVLVGTLNVCRITEFLHRYKTIAPYTANHSKLICKTLKNLGFTSNLTLVFFLMLVSNKGVMPDLNYSEIRE